jgi:predicted dehydrogenase
MTRDNLLEFPLRVGIIGAGRMGRIRALSAQAHPDCVVVSVSDTVPSQAAQLAQELNCSVDENWTTLLKRAEVNSVVIATPHKFLAPITVAAIQAGKRVFCEKPMARNAKEAEEIVHALKSSAPDTPGHSLCLPRSVVVGYTLRHHPAIVRAKELTDQGFIGEPFYVRGRYGHGGRSGYEKEWRGDRDLSGGGELLDQGVHLIDLSRWFLGEFQEVTGFLNTYFWVDRSTPTAGSPVACSTPENGNSSRREVEDNAFMLLRTSSNKTAMLHVSWTQWKNMFSFEVFGGEGFLTVEGLGGSYGSERLLMGRRSNSGAVPHIEEIAFELCSEPGLKNKEAVHSGKHSCWDEEWAAFVRVARNGASNGSRAVSSSTANAVDGVQALKVVDAVYLSAANSLGSAREVHK